MRQCPKCGSDRVYRCSKLNEKTGYTEIWYGCMHCSYVSEVHRSDTSDGVLLMSEWHDLAS